MISKIEVALRARLVEALLIHGELLVLQDPSIFKEKKRYWQNAATVASENTSPSMWTLGGDQPVIPRVTFIR